MPAAVSVQRYYQFFRRRQVRTVLDYGAGKLRNALFLAEKGFEVVAADLPEQIAKCSAGPAFKAVTLMAAADLAHTNLDVDLVISNFVFNIIPDTGAKEAYLDNIVRNLRRRGFFLIEVQCRQKGSLCGSECTFFMKCRSCIKTLSHLELDLMVMPYGFKRLSHYYRRRALAALYQLIDKPSQAGLY